MASTPDFGWQILLDENEWDRDTLSQIPNTDNPAPLPQKTRLRSGWTIAGIALCLALAGGLHLWQQAHIGLSVVEKSLSHTVTLENQAKGTGDDLLAAALLDPQAEADWRALVQMNLGQAGEQAVITDFVLHGKQAIARVRVTHPESGRVYRESRFYRETTGGWLRTQPDASLWGNPTTMESEYFVFHFRQLDKAAVAVAAPLLDAAYLHIHTALALPLRAIHDAESKIPIHIATVVEATAYHWYDRGKPLWVDSPWLLRLPDDMTDGNALAEMVASSLRRSAVNELLSPLSDMDEPTAGLLGGLRLWLTWEKTTLAQNHNKIGNVGWLYENTPHSPQRTSVSFPETCELFDTGQIVSPAGPAFFYCSVEPAFPFSSYSRPPISLAQLPISQPQYGSYVDGSAGLAGQPGVDTQGQAIAFATILKYAAYTYGPASVPALLQAAREGKNWATATPQIFGLSAKEFEAGWWEWLAEKYGMETTGF